MNSRTPLQSLCLVLVLGAILLVGPGCVHVPYALQSQQESLAQIGPGVSHSLTNENTDNLSAAAHGWYEDWTDWTPWADVARGWNADYEQSTQP